MKDQFQLSEIQETYLHALLISLHESLVEGDDAEPDVKVLHHHSPAGDHSL